MTTAMLLLSLFTSISMWAADEVFLNGKFGNSDVQWIFQNLEDGSGGSLRIFGDGAIPDFDDTDNPSPLLNLQTELKIKTIRIENGVTRIGNYLFAKEDLLADVTSLTLPQSVTSIGAHAFEGSGLKSVTLNEGGWKRLKTMPSANVNSRQ